MPREICSAPMHYCARMRDVVAPRYLKESTNQSDFLILDKKCIVHREELRYIKARETRTNNNDSLAVKHKDQQVSLD